jgi:hypothetical protein
MVKPTTVGKPRKEKFEYRSKLENGPGDAAKTVVSARSGPGGICLANRPVAWRMQSR